MVFSGLGLGRSMAAALAFLLLAFAAQRPALADPGAFTQQLIDQGVAILGDNSGGVAARNARFRDFLLKYADIEATAKFTLGVYRRQASEAEFRDFVEAFKDFATAIYEKRLEKYAGQTLKVTGVVENKPGDYTVNAVEAGNNPNPLKVAFRLLGSPGAYRFVDVNVAGIWLAVEQRDQFSSFLSTHGGKVPFLSADLRRQAAAIRAGG